MKRYYFNRLAEIITEMARHGRTVSYAEVKPLPDGRALITLHWCQYDCNDSDHPYHTVSRISVRVEVQVGDVVFSREYATSDE